MTARRVPWAAAGFFLWPARSRKGLTQFLNEVSHGD
jgi:hypothetical protein